MQKEVDAFRDHECQTLMVLDPIEDIFRGRGLLEIRNLIQLWIAAQISVQRAAPASSNPANVGVNSTDFSFALELPCAPFFVHKRKKTQRGSKCPRQIESVGLTSVYPIGSLSLACCVPG